MNKVLLTSRIHVTTYYTFDQTSAMAPSRGIIRCTISSRFAFTHLPHHRTFSIFSHLSSGHNRWSKIKHDKGKNDAAKNRQRSVFANEITNASKLYGPDPNSNPKLADIITKAKREGFAKASIEGAIARGQGKSASGAKLETVTLEGILPGNVGFIVECETDNKARTMMELRQVLKDAGGSATPSAYLFEKQGRVVLDGKPGIGMNEVLDVALDAGAEEITEEENMDITLLCEATATNAVREKVSSEMGMTVKSAEILWNPIKDTMIELDDIKALEGYEAFIDALRDREPNAVVAVNLQDNVNVQSN